MTRMAHDHRLMRTLMTVRRTISNSTKPLPSRRSDRGWLSCPTQRKRQWLVPVEERGQVLAAERASSAASERRSRSTRARRGRFSHPSGRRCGPRHHGRLAMLHRDAGACIHGSRNHRQRHAMGAAHRELSVSDRGACGSGTRIRCVVGRPAQGAALAFSRNCRLLQGCQAGALRHQAGVGARSGMTGGKLPGMTRRLRVKTSCGPGFSRTSAHASRRSRRVGGEVPWTTHCPPIFPASEADLPQPQFFVDPPTQRRQFGTGHRAARRRALSRPRAPAFMTPWVCRSPVVSISLSSTRCSSRLATELVVGARNLPILRRPGGVFIEVGGLDDDNGACDEATNVSSALRNLRLRRLVTHPERRQGKSVLLDVRVPRRNALPVLGDPGFIMIASLAATVIGGMVVDGHSRGQVCASNVTRPEWSQRGCQRVAA